MLGRVTDADCLEFICEYIAKNGYAPSVREIAEGVGLVSLSAASSHLRNLEKRGQIKREKGLSRAMKVMSA
jgi:repressor LexA